MEYPHIHILNTFDLASLPDLDVAVLAALELFQKAPLPAAAGGGFWQCRGDR